MGIQKASSKGMKKNKGSGHKAGKKTKSKKTSSLGGGAAGANSKSAGHSAKGKNGPENLSISSKGKNKKGARVAASSLKNQVGGDTDCREVACEGLATSEGYCRLHYIKNWKKIKQKSIILREGKLNQYIQELVAKYPDKYIEAIRQDLASDKDFSKVIYDLDLDEGVEDFEIEGGEPVDTIIDTLKRDFEDEGEPGF